MSDSLRPLGCPWSSLSQNTRKGSLSLLQGIFPTQWWNSGLPALQVDSFPAAPQGKPKNAGVGSLLFLEQTFPTQESNRDLLHCRWILYQLSYQGSPFFGCEQRKIPHVQGQRRIPRKIVGGAKSQLESNPIPARDTRRAQTKPCVHQDSEPR